MKTIPLAVAGAFHTSLMQPAADLIGTVAEARLESGPVAPSAAVPPDGPGETVPGSDPEPVPAFGGPPPALLEFAARAKRSVELGPAQPVIEAVDVIPDEVYALLGDLARVVATPETAARFLEYPGAAELANHPKIRALQGDPDIADLLERGLGALGLLGARDASHPQADFGILRRLVLAEQPALSVIRLGFRPLQELQLGFLPIRELLATQAGQQLFLAKQSRRKHPEDASGDQSSGEARTHHEQGFTARSRSCEGSRWCRSAPPGCS